MSVPEILEARGLADTEALTKFTDRLSDEAPEAVAIVQAIQELLAASEVHTGNLVDQTYDMSRPHLAIFIGQIDQLLYRLITIIECIHLDSRAVNDNALGAARDGLVNTGQALTEVVQALLTKNP
jgi:hypothetical protein